MNNDVFETRHDNLGRRGILSSWMSRQRIFRAQKFLVPPVLDFGCSSFAGLADFFDHYSYLGVDIQQKAVEKAAKRFPKHKFKTPIELAENEKFNSIACLAVLEHIKQNSQLYFLKTLKDFLKDNGRLVLSTPLPVTNFIHFIGGKIGFFSNLATEEHEKLLNMEDLVELVKNAGFLIEYHQPFMFRTNQLLVARKK